MLEKSFIPYLVSFAWISAFLLLGTFLRAKIKFFQKYLFPASLIGGVLGFICMSLGWIGIPSVEKGWIPIPNGAFSLVAFHLFSFGFVAIGLGSGGGNNISGGSKKDILKGSLWMALIFAVLGTLQSLIGGGVFAGWNAVSGSDFYAPLGFLVGHGYTQGPGQTLAIATVWQNTFKIPDAISIGLSFAAIGFFVAALIGVPLAYWGIRRGYATQAPKELPNDFLVGLMDKDSNVSAGRHTTHSGNIDTVAFHLAIMGLAYGVAWLMCYGLKYYVLPKSLGALTFGFIFFYGLISALIIRTLINKFGGGYLIDDNIQRRITGTTVDYMVVSVMMAVKLTAIWTYIVPILITTLLAAMVTLLLMLYFGRRVPGLGLERMLAMFGYCTGTGASGLLLLRIVDPEFKTPVAIEVGIMNLFAIFTFTHIVFLIGLVPGPTFPSVMGMVGLYVGTIVVCVALLKICGLWKQRQF